MTTIDIPLGAVDLPQVILRATGARVLSRRHQVAAWLVSLANRISGGNLAVVEAEPPLGSYTVSVEKIGVDMLLRVGDRAARLPRSDARYVGELLECGWTSSVYNVRAHHG